MSDKKKAEIDKEMIVKAQRAYKKAWRAKNKDKVKAANDRFYAKIAAKIAAENAVKTD